MSKIEWTQETLNPVVGCQYISPGCLNCYAINMANRLTAMSRTQKSLEKYQQPLIKKVNNQLVWTGRVVCDLATLDKAKERKKPTTYFVASMGDLFHDDVPYHFLVQVFRVFIAEKRHTFQILTKRTQRMAILIPLIYQEILGTKMPPHNVWLGTSTERQQELDQRLPLLMQTPATVRFLSVEPMLSPVTLCHHDLLPDWIIVGGESGRSARSMDLSWAESLIAECNTLGISTFFKQSGSNPTYHEKPFLVTKKGSDLAEMPPTLRIRQFPHTISK